MMETDMRARWLLELVGGARARSGRRSSIVGSIMRAAAGVVRPRLDTEQNR